MASREDEYSRQVLPSHLWHISHILYNLFDSQHCLAQRLRGEGGASRRILLGSFLHRLVFDGQSKATYVYLWRLLTIFKIAKLRRFVLPLQFCASDAG